MAPKVTLEITREQVNSSNHRWPREPALRSSHHQKQRMISDVVGGATGRQIAFQIAARRTLRTMMVRAHVAEAAALEPQNHRQRLIDSVPTESARETTDRFETRARIHLHRAARMETRRANL